MCQHIPISVEIFIINTFHYDDEIKDNEIKWLWTFTRGNSTEENSLETAALEV
jgi:hypothetical protein